MARNRDQRGYRFKQAQQMAVKRKTAISCRPKKWMHTHYNRVDIDKRPSIVE